MELVKWSRANFITLDVLQRLWKAHIFSTILWGLAICVLSCSQLQRLNVMQRQVGRLLLGHSKKSPIPTVCCELGWMLWSTAVQGSQFKLYQRLSNSKNRLSRFLLRCSLSSEGSWGQKVAAQLQIFNASDDSASDDLSPSNYSSLEGDMLATRWLCQPPALMRTHFSNLAFRAKLLVGIVPGGLTPPRMPTRILLGRSINQSINILF